MAGNILLYDADCGMCTRFRDIVDRLDLHRNFRFMSIDRAEQLGLLDALPDGLRHRSFHIVLPDRQIESGAAALPTLVSLLPTGGLVSKMITSAPFGPWIISFLYSVVSRRHEAGLCKLPAGPADMTSELDDPWKRTKASITRSPRIPRSQLSVY